MCGIAGVLNLDGSPVDPAVIERMLEVQHHRGPDDRGLRLFSLASGASLEPAADDRAPREGFEGALGFNRLAILDLSAQGHQPMVSADGRVALVYNGEVYNAFDFRAELESAGFRFRSRCDTEVLLYLYERHGLDGMLERLNGMFAIAIADLRLREVHLARDPFGVKPLYWTQAGRAVMFASEPKAFASHPAFAPRLDEARFDEYLAFRYCADDRHLLAGVKQVRPGHCVRVTASGVAARRYRAIPDPPRPAIGFAQAQARLEAQLRASVKSQLLSDVKVGCQLSGGIDSSLVAANALADLGAPMESFSIVFDDERFSEARWIDEAVRAINAAGASRPGGLASHRHVFSADDFFATLEPATWHMDQPVNHPNSLGIYRLAEMARASVTVLLSGEGADELLGGYSRHYFASIRPRVLPWLPLLARLPSWGERFARNFGMDHGDPASAFIAASMFMRPAEIRALRPGFDAARAIAVRRPTFDEGRGDHVANCLAYDMQTYMADLLVRQDKMTMAHSVENRVPFLDTPLVDVARSLPPDSLVGDRITFPPSTMRNTKKVLKALAGRRFGSGFAYRSKSGFGLPLAGYYADARFERLMRERLLPGMRSRGLVRADAVERMWRGIVERGAGNVEGLWVPVAFELWAQRFLDAGGMPR